MGIELALKGHELVPAWQQCREVVEIHRKMLAEVWNTTKRHQQLLQLAHLLHGAVDEGAVRRQIDEKLDPADRLAICGAEAAEANIAEAADAHMLDTTSKHDVVSNKRAKTKAIFKHTTVLTITGKSKKRKTVDVEA